MCTFSLNSWEGSLVAFINIHKFSGTFINYLSKVNGFISQVVGVKWRFKFIMMFCI